MQVHSKKKAATPAVAASEAPELAAADQKVGKAKEQLETAKKQLEAARALVRAAEADFKAAKASREALALQLKADGLAGASGLKQLAAQSQATNTNSARLSPAPTAAAQPAQTAQQESGQTRVQQGDFSAEPAQADAPQLR